MFNTIYPSSHVVVQYHQIHHQAQVDRRMTGRHQQGMVERPLQLFNFEVAPPPPQQQQQGGRRRVPPGYRQHQHNTPIPVMPSPHPHHHFRPVMNGRMQDFSNPRFFNGKHNMGRLYHGISAPCLSTASLGSGAVTGDESSDSGLSSRSPTPNRLQQSAAEEPSEKPKDSGKTEEDNPVPTQDNDREEDEDEGKGEEEDDNTENNLKNGRLRQHQYQHRQQYNNYQQYRRNDQHHQHHQGGGGHYYAKRRMAPSGVPLANNQLPPGGRYPNHNNHHHNNFRGRRISVPAPYSVRCVL
ncbi:hypothetical protein AAG570_004110 [Ranatra chinensis]|uniref:Uncharacterized protein n=1 Tax=Ranatra chinensis TaxID=642074 RepID=A0ABD0Y455_9HEMI